MPNPRFETAIGVIDDVNVSFSTSVNYVGGTLAVFRNGVLQEKTSDNGWIELGGDAFDMKVAPVIDDILQVFYMDTQPSPDPGVEEVEEIHCVLDDDDDLTTTLEDADAIMCVLDDDDDLIGVLVETEEISCVLDNDDDIVCILEECES